MNLLWQIDDLKIYFVPRSEWGASQDTEDFIEARFSATAEEKTTIQIHHTAGVDDDATPNQWSYTDARAYMKRLEWVRLAELGPLPYSENVAISEDGNTVWLFEGRGILKVGAHTAGHNRDGVGWGILGNFDKATPSRIMENILLAIELRVAMLRGQGLVNLGSVKNPKGWNAWGHRDTAAKSCPGNNLYPLLADFAILDDMAFSPEEEARLRALLAEIDSSANPAFDVSFNKAVAVGMFSSSTLKTHIITAAKLAVFLDRKGLLDALPSTLLKRGDSVTLE